MEIPAFLSTLLTRQYAQADVRRILAGFDTPRRTTLRVNRIRAEQAAVREALDRSGITTQPVAWYEDALVVLHAREDALMQLDMYARGDIYVQSLSSMIPPLVLGAQPGENVLIWPLLRRKDHADRRADGRSALITACERNGAEWNGSATT